MTRRRVLVVEDDSIAAIDVERALVELGHQVSIADSGDGALRMAATQHPDIALVALELRGALDAVTTAERLASRHDVPVVFLAGRVDDAALESMTRAAPHGFVLAPPRSEDLRATIGLVTHRHLIERRDRLRERRPASLDAPPDGAISVDASGHVTLATDAAAALLGLPAAELPGIHIDAVVRVFDERSGDPLPPAARTVLETGQAVVPRLVLLFEHGDGTTRPVRESAAPIRSGGRVIGALVTLHDHSHEQATQLRLEQTDRLAVLGTMASSVAHEINNPLAVVTANADYVEDHLSSLLAQAAEPLAPARLAHELGELTSSMADVRSAARRIAQVAADLRDFARPQLTRPGRVDVAHSIDWAIRATAHHLRMRARLIKDLTPVPPVAGDDVRLGQVMVNLLVNAADAISPGAVEKNTITLCTRVAPDGRVVIEVRDTGAGLTPAARARIFEPFFTVQPRTVGSGLGLAICHGIVRSFGGDIEVDDAPGAGTQVRLLIPPAAEEPTLPAEDTGDTDEVRGRILVIDDERPVLRAVQRTLHEHQVTCVDTAQEALREIDAGQHFDVILSDVMMPERTGFDFYQELLDRSPAFAESVVFLTGDGAGEKAHDFLRAVPTRWSPSRSSRRCCAGWCSRCCSTDATCAPRICPARCR